MLKEENSREDGAEETDRKGAGGRKGKGAPKDPQARRGAGCVRVLLLCACWPHVPQQNAHGTERLDVSKRLRPADLTLPSDQRSRCQTPPPNRDVFRGFSGGLWGDATFLDRPRKVSAWMALVMNQRLESFLFNSNFDKHAFSRLTSLEREHAALNSELPEIKQKRKKKIKTPCATRHETMFPPLLPRF